MYVDKKLSGVQAVQTLSRLNRAHPNKQSAFVLDFYNNADTVTAAFADYYRTTLLSEETDQNKLHDLQRELEDRKSSRKTKSIRLSSVTWPASRRDTLDPLLDPCVALYKTTLDEDGQVEFKGKAKAFVRTYDFLASILPYSNASWEKLSIFLTMLVRKLPAPTEEDLSKGILDAINMDSYRVEKQERLKIMLGDEDAEIDPTPTGGGGRKPEPELVRLSEILQTFNEQFGTLFTDADRIFRRIKDDVVPAVEKDEAYQNAKMNTPGKARLELTAAVKKAMGPMLRDDTEFYKQFVQNDSFKQFVVNVVDQILDHDRKAS